MTSFNYLPPLTPYLDIVFRDEQLLVLNKPSGLLSVPGRLEQHKDSLALRVLRVLPDAKVVHRLDMATSGIIVMPLGKAAQSHLGRQFQQRMVTKRYEALVWGQLEQDEGTVDLPLRCDWPNRPKQMVDHQEGKSALTQYKVLARYPDRTRVALFPVTGRSHQLRVHMLALGHPIIGDQLYADGEALAASERLCLHAAELSLEHPGSGLPQKFSAQVPF